MAVKVIPTENNSAVTDSGKDVADNLFYLLVEDKHKEDGKWVKVARVNLDSIFQQTLTEKLNKTQLKIQSKWIEDHLKSLEKEMEEYGIQQTIDMKNLSSEASPSMETNENKIKTSLSILLIYLKSSNNSLELQDDFFEVADTLPSTIKDLIDGLLDQNSNKVDTMASLREAFKV